METVDVCARVASVYTFVYFKKCVSVYASVCPSLRNTLETLIIFVDVEKVEVFAVFADEEIRTNDGGVYPALVIGRGVGGGYLIRAHTGRGSRRRRTESRDQPSRHCHDWETGGSLQSTPTTTHHDAQSVSK